MCSGACKMVCGDGKFESAARCIEIELQVVFATSR
jgi:hypothetical protein